MFSEKITRKLYLAAPIFAPCLTLILASCIVSNSYATPSSISISLSSAPSVNIASTSEGKFGDSGNSTITITTTHAAGYTLTAKASNSTNLEGTNGGSIPSITSAVSPTNYADNTYASSHNLNDTWAYKPSVLYNASTQTTNPNTDYLPSPGTGTAQSPIDTLAVTNDANDGSYTVSIGARVSTATAIDEYSNSFVFAVVGNPTPYAITYNKNTTDTVTNMPTNHTTSDPGATGETVTIDSTVPVRDGYNFKGWCSTTTSDDTCSGTVYNPDGGGTSLNLTINQTSSTNAFTLYAMWKVDGINLYNTVASMSKGKQTAQDLQQTITVPTSADRTQDTSNSGVYEYDPTVFGTASDASNANIIYYYRGVLEQTVGSYGSDGSATTYPNYVVLSSAANSSGLTTSDTCWRIVRTTGSGGIKMIYNGKWTGSTCANATTAAEATTSAYNGTSSTTYRIALVGYTYNPTYGDSDVTTATSVDTVFGSNSNYSANSSNSTMKGYIENTWFSNISTYESILEPSAGYCNDRTVYSDNTTSTALSTIVPSTTTGYTYFGAYGRNANATNAGKAPSLTCPSNRNVVDLYTTSSASNGNKQLAKPAALLTADEVSLAGSGQSTASEGSAYHANSFLYSGSDFWLLSPNSRAFWGVGVLEFSLSQNGYLSNPRMDGSYGVRPAISLKSGTTAASGSGIATDPWVVMPPTTFDTAFADAGKTKQSGYYKMQDASSSICSAVSQGQIGQLIDTRDNEVYYVGKLADDKCWMLDNLRLDPANSTTLNNITDSNTHASATSINYFKNGGGTTSDQYPTAKINNVAWSTNNYFSIPLTISTYKDTTTTSYGAGSGKIGVYYNYCATTAGSYCYGNGTSGGTSSGNATEDLCPAGWRMPTGDSSGEYQALYTAYSNDTINFRNALSTPLSGYFSDGSARSRNDIGVWWASTRSIDRYMYNLYIDASTVNPANNNGRGIGMPLRCITQ